MLSEVPFMTACLPCSCDTVLWFRTNLGFVVSFLSSYILLV